MLHCLSLCTLAHHRGLEWGTRNAQVNTPQCCAAARSHETRSLDLRSRLRPRLPQLVNHRPAAAANRHSTLSPAWRMRRAGDEIAVTTLLQISEAKARGPGGDRWTHGGADHRSGHQVTG